MFRLDGKVAVITGGARGIGAETARVFRDAGATVVTWDVAEGADQQTDVTDVAAVTKAVAEVVKRHGRIDVLVNNAGILRDAQLVKVKDDAVVGAMSEADFDAVVAVNLRGVFVCTQAVAPVMIKQRSGRILNASSGPRWSARCRTRSSRRWSSGRRCAGSASRATSRTRTCSSPRTRRRS